MAWDSNGDWVEENEDPYKYADYTQDFDGYTQHHTYDPGTQQEHVSTIWDGGTPWAPTPNGRADFVAPGTTTTPTATPTPPPAPPGPSGGGGGGGGMATGNIIPQNKLPLYQPFDFGQFTPMDFSLEEGLVRKKMNDLIASPGGLSDIEVARLKERSKEESLGYQGQITQKLRQDAARRGVSGGGQLQASERRLGQDMASTVLRSNRDIDIEQANRRMTDQQNNLDFANRTMAAMSGRQLANSQFTLALNAAKAAEARAAHLSQTDQARFALESALANANLGLGYANLNQQAYQSWLNSILNGTN